MPSWTYRGDINRALEWYTFAVTELKSMIIIGTPVMTLNPVEGVTIMLQAVPPHIHIMAEGGGIYLESGFIYLGSIAKCSDTTYKAAILNFSPAINSYLALTETPLEGKAVSTGEGDESSIDYPYSGEVLIDGQKSISVGGRSLSDTVVDQCGNEYTSPFLIYSYTEIWMQKICQRYVPSSLYSGKMRLFVQALYGSERKDYSMPLFGEQSLPKSTAYYLLLKDTNDDLLGLRSDIETSGLFTTAKYDYYIIIVQFGSVTFHPLLLSSTGKLWQEKLIGLLEDNSLMDDYFLSRVEAYILSTASVDMNLSIKVQTGLDVSGIPFAYGFKFNKMGNECKCIFHENIGGNKFQPNVVTITINDDLTINASVVARGEWSNGTGLQTWFPDYFDMQVKGFGDPGLFYTQSANVPLYGYYVNDVFEEFVINFTSTNEIHSDIYQDLTSVNFPGYGIDPPENANQEIISSSGNPINFGNMSFSFNEESKSFRIMGSHQNTVYKNALILDNNLWGGDYYSRARAGPIMRNGVAFRQWLVDEYGPPSGGQYGWVKRPGTDDSNTFYNLETDTYSNGAPKPWNGLPYLLAGEQILKNSVYYQIYDFKFNNTFQGKVLFAVPFDDCEAVVYGWNETESWTQRTTGSYTTNELISGTKVRTSEHSGSNIFNSSTLGVYVEYDVKQLIDIQGAANQGIKNIVQEGAGGNQETEVKYHSSASKGVHFKNNDGFILDSDLTGETIPPWAEKYFSYGDQFGLFHPKMVARASANGASLLLHDEGDGDNNNGFPNDNGLLNSSVGWN